MRIEYRPQFLARQARDLAAAYASVGATYRPDDERLLAAMEPVIGRILEVRAMRYRHPRVVFDDVPALLAMVNEALDEYEAGR